MNREHLTLLEFPCTTEDLVTNRIDGLLDVLCLVNDEKYVVDVIQMLLEYLEVNYESEGEYIWQVELRLLESIYWFKTALDLE